MRVLGTTVPVVTSDIDAAIATYSALTGEPVKARFDVAERGLAIALVGSLALIAGSEGAVAPLRGVRATFTVDSIEEYEAYLRLSGATILEPPASTPAGRSMVARLAGGVVFEFVELRQDDGTRP